MLKASIILAKVLLSAGLVWLAFSKIDLDSGWATVRAITPLALAAAAAFFALQFVLAALRLRAFLRALGVRYRVRAALDVIMIGAFFSQTLISFVGGDAMRIWRIVRSRVSVAVAAKSVLFDRIAGFAGLFVLLLAATPFLARLVQSAEMFAGQLLIVLLALGGIGAAFLVRRLPDVAPRWRPFRLAREVVDTGLEIWRSKRGAWLVLGLSVGIQLLNVVILYVLGHGLGMDLRFLDGLLLFPTVLFLSMLPISVAGWGVREGAMIAALALVGIPPHQGLALSVCFGLGLIVVSLPGGLVWLAARHRPIGNAAS